MFIYCFYKHCSDQHLKYIVIKKIFSNGFWKYLKIQTITNFGILWIFYNNENKIKNNFRITEIIITDTKCK